MDYGTLDRWYGTLPPIVICDDTSASLGELDRWYGTLPPPVGADEYVAGGATAIKTLQGLAKASAKTYQGLAVASVKTIQGLA